MKLIVAIVAFAFLASPVKADDLSDLKARLKVLEDKAGIKTIAQSGPGTLGSTPTVVTLKTTCECGLTCPCVAAKAAAPVKVMFFDGVKHEQNATTGVYHPVATSFSPQPVSFAPASYPAQSFSVPLNFAAPRVVCANGKCTVR